MAKGKYQEWLEQDKLNYIEALARRGCTDREIADAMGIVPSTFYEWIKAHVDISNAIKNGREISIVAVENALFKSAIGYTYVEQQLNKKGELVEVTKTVQPNLGAQIFILKNRKPQYWKDKIMTDDDERAIEQAKDVLVQIKKVAGISDK